jgi:hypothetical protein
LGSSRRSATPERPAERDEQVSGDVALVVANLIGTLPVHRDEQTRRVERLLDPQVHRARHPAHPVQESLGHRAVARQVVADDLHVERRRESEIEDLADHVDGQEVEGDAREFAAQLRAELPGHPLDRPVPLLHRDEDVGVAGPDAGAELL